MLNDVYLTVQTIINKENAGYVSPVEFNLLAKQVQEEIFKAYFEDENRDKTRQNRGFISKGYANLPFNQRQRIVQFAKDDDVTGAAGVFSLPTDLYQIEDDGVVTDTGNVAEEVERSMFGYLNQSLSVPDATFPVYEHVIGNINILPITITDVNIRYIRKPLAPNWTYTVVSGKEMYDPSNGSFQDFELHPSEFSNIVVRMAGYFSVNLREEEVARVVGQKIQENEIKDNQ